MKRTMILGAFVLAASLTAPLAAYAECNYPKAPASMPDGKSATEQEMISAMTAFKQYNSDVNTYLTCLDQETTARLQDGSIPAEQAMQFKALQTRKHNSVVDELQAKADQFNEQVRAFKARNG